MIGDKNNEIKNHVKKDRFFSTANNPESIEPAKAMLKIMYKSVIYC